jgi:tRNA modification GTPase
LARSLALGFLRGSPLVPKRAALVELLTSDGVRIDQAVQTFHAGPRSYTGEDSVEWTVHGNPWIVDRLVALCCDKGCRIAEPGEFTRRAFLNGRIDLSQAEAVADVIRARSDAALAAAQRQLAGELGRRIRTLVDLLVDSLAGLEAYIDFPEEDLPPEERLQHLQRIQSISEQAGKLAQTAKHRRYLQEGLRVALAGAPNAGKSSLLNQLAGKERSIVHPSPGTTRDYVEEPVLLGGHKVILIDTAGLRKTEDPIEREGIARTRHCLQAADLVLWIHDASDPSPTLETLLGEQPITSPFWLIINKIDIYQTPRSHHPTPPFAEIHALSALHGNGVSALKESLENWIRQDANRGHPEDLVVNERHAQALNDAVDFLASAQTRLRQGPPDVFVASDLRAALEALGSITGTVDNEAILDRLFATFCIGK